MKTTQSEAILQFMNSLDPKAAYECYTITLGSRFNLVVKRGLNHSFQRTGINPNEGYQSVKIGPSIVPIILDNEDDYQNLANSVKAVRINHGQKFGSYSLAYPDTRLPSPKLSDEYILVNFMLRPFTEVGDHVAHVKITGDRQYVDKLGFSNFPGCIFLSARLDNSENIPKNNQVPSGVDALALMRKDGIARIGIDHNTYYSGPFRNGQISKANAKMHLKLGPFNAVDNWQVRDLREDQITLPSSLNLPDGSEEMMVDLITDIHSDVYGEDCYFLKWIPENQDITGISFGRRFYESEAYGFTSIPFAD